MFWDDILLVTEQAERYGLRTPFVDLCGEPSPCIADYDLTIKTGDQLARFVSLDAPPFAHLDPAYSIVNEKPSLDLFRSIGERCRGGIGFGTLLSVLERCEDPLAALKNIFEVMSSNSILVVSACFAYPYAPDPHDYWRFTPEALKLLGEKAGFTVLESRWRLHVPLDAGIKELKFGAAQEVRTVCATLVKGAFVAAPGKKFTLPLRRSSNPKAAEIIHASSKTAPATMIQELSPGKLSTTSLEATMASLLGSQPVAQPPLLRGRHCVFLNTFYPGFLTSVYSKVQNLSRMPYEDQLRVLQESCFGDSDFYSKGMIKAGWQSTDLILNAPLLQQQWAREHAITGSDKEIALRQIRDLRPDVVYCQDMHYMARDFLAAIRPHTKLIVGQIASPFGDIPLDMYDLVISSFPHFAERFAAKGVHSLYQPLAFDPRVLRRLPVEQPYLNRQVMVSFVGGISPEHTRRFEMLQKFAETLPIEFWGYGKESLLSDSPILKRHHGEVWGREMFKALADSRITINVHIDAAEHNANNMRLFEATGMGALLMTDYKDNLSDLFDIGDEIIAYRHPEECAALVRYYLENPREAEAIAAAGQARTLRDHTYEKRMEVTAHTLEELLRSRA